MNCSAKARSARGARWRQRTACCASLLLSICFSVSGHAQGTAELDDAAARAQYAYLTGDPRALEATLVEVEQSSFESNLSALKSYQLAYGHWKLAQLHAKRGASARAAASKAAKACVEHAKATVQHDARFAEAYAVQAVCEDKPYVASTEQGEGACDRNRGLRTAMNLAPKNPRVQFIAALCARPGQSAQSDEAVRWREVVDAFEQAPKERSAVLDWGQAEALTALARALWSVGQSVAARDAAERALVIAPDYDAAQSVLKSIAQTR